MTTGKTIALTMWTFVGELISLIIIILSKFVIAFLPKSKHLFISWLQSPPTMILELKKTCLLAVSSHGRERGKKEREGLRILVSLPLLLRTFR